MYIVQHSKVQHNDFDLFEKMKNSKLLKDAKLYSNIQSTKDIFRYFKQFRAPLDSKFTKRAN